MNAQLTHFDTLEQIRSIEIPCEFTFAPRCSQSATVLFVPINGTVFAPTFLTMNKLIVPALLAIGCFGGVADAAFPTLAEKEAASLQSYRAGSNAEDLVALAWLREARGKYRESLQTLDLLRKSYGSSQSKAFTEDDKPLNYKELADWMEKRVRTKQRGVKQVSLATRRAMQNHFDKHYANNQRAQAEQADLNGDGLKEMVSYDSQGQYLRVHEWANGRFIKVWQSHSTPSEGVSNSYFFNGGEGKDWPGVFVAYSNEDPTKDSAGHLKTNGDSWLLFYN